MALAVLMWTWLAGASASASHEHDPGLRFLYVNASEHGASGGHTAVAVGDDVYHYQHHADGIFRLVREAWPSFRRRYNDFENRTLRIARIDVDAADRERVRARFAREHLIQRAQIRMQGDLEGEVAALEVLGGAQRGLELRGMGLFHGAAGDADGVALRAAVEATLGAGFVDAERRRVEEALAATRPEVRPLEAASIVADAYPPRAAHWSRKVRELLTLRLAIDVLYDAVPVDDALLVDPEAFEREPRVVGVRERAGLVLLRGELETAVCALLRSSRPDRGFPLLVSIARHRAVAMSLRTGRLVVLDVLPKSGPEVAARRVAEMREPLRGLRPEARASYRHVRRAVLADGRVDEAAYNTLENAATRYHELARALDLGAALRTAPGRHVPDRAGSVSATPVPVKDQRPAEMLDRARRNASAGRQRLRALYPYDLLRRNCATELLRVVGRAFSSDAAAARALGGEVRAGEGFAFIPFAWFEHVRTHLRVSSIEVLPSYRLRGLEARYAREGRLRVYLEEANTFTSTLYPGSVGDEAFLLFTDDVTWPRPLYAVANGAWALGATGAGLLTAPFDGSERLSRGLRGIVWSVPELFFMNVRKGSFAGSPAMPEVDRAAPPDVR
jgi:hypothetical protein